MKFSCTKDNLQRALRTVGYAAGKQTNLPILQNVHIKADTSDITLSTTNLELAVRVHMRGRVDRTGEFTVPAKLFLDFVNLLSHDRIDIELIGASLNIQCGSTSTQMNGSDAADYPLIPTVQGTEVFSLPAGALKEGLDQTMFSVAMLEVRLELSGVLFAMTPGKLTLASTDTHRLSQRELTVEQMTGERSVVIPQRGLAEVVRMIANEEEEETHVQLQLAQNQAVFRYGLSEVITRTIDAAYPDYKQIIPKHFQTEFTVDRETFAKAIKAASLFSQDNEFDVHIVVNAAEKTVQVSAANAKRGKNSVSCATDTVTGGDFSLKMNGRYVIDGLSAMESQGITCRISDAHSPCVFQPNGLGDIQENLYIVMPLLQ